MKKENAIQLLKKVNEATVDGYIPTKSTNLVNKEYTDNKLIDDIIKSNKLKGKKVLTVGDSFFAGKGTGVGYTNPYILLDDLLGTTTTNIAVPGASFISDSSNCINTTLSNYINSNDISDFDFILLSGGGNDCYFNNTLSIGTFTDIDTLLPSTTVLGQVQRIFNMLKEKGKLKNLLYVFGHYCGSNANGLKNIPLLEEKIFPMIEAYGVQYIYFKDRYTIDQTVDNDGMHPLDSIYENVVFHDIIPYMLYIHLNNIYETNNGSQGNNGSSTSTSTTTLTTLCQGDLTYNGIDLNITGNKITFTAKQNITSARMFFISGDSLLGGTQASDLSSKLSNTFFDCGSGNTLSLELQNVQSTNSSVSGYVSIVNQSGTAQVTVYPQSTTSASATISGTTCGLVCAINNLNTSDVVSFNIIVKKNGVEIGNEFTTGDIPIDENVKNYIDTRLSNLTITTITQADYDALATKDPNTLYLITTTNAGSIDNENNITLSSDLPSGRYTLKYEDENGQPLSDFDNITTMEV